MGSLAEIPLVRGGSAIRGGLLRDASDVEDMRGGAKVRTGTDPVTAKSYGGGNGATIGSKEAGRVVAVALYLVVG